MIKNRFKDDYSWSARLNGKGRVVDDICYTGTYYILPFTKEEKKKTNRSNMAFAFVLIVLQVAAGMVNQDSSRTIWVLYPYLFTFLPVFYFLVGAFSYWSDPLRMQQAQYETGLARMRRSCIGSMVMTVISIVLDVIYMIIHRGDMQTGREFLYVGILVLYVTAALMYGRYYDRTYAGLRTEQSQNKLE